MPFGGLFGGATPAELDELSRRLRGGGAAAGAPMPFMYPPQAAAPPELAGPSKPPQPPQPVGNNPFAGARQAPMAQAQAVSPAATFDAEWMGNAAARQGRPGAAQDQAAPAFTPRFLETGVAGSGFGRMVQSRDEEIEAQIEKAYNQRSAQAFGTAWSPYDYSPRERLQIAALQASAGSRGADDMASLIQQAEQRKFATGQADLNRAFQREMGETELANRLKLQSQQQSGAETLEKMRGENAMGLQRLQADLANSPEAAYDRAYAGTLRMLQENPNISPQEALALAQQAAEDARQGAIVSRRQRGAGVQTQPAVPTTPAGQIDPTTGQMALGTSAPETTPGYAGPTSDAKAKAASFERVRQYGRPFLDKDGKLAAEPTPQMAAAFLDSLAAGNVSSADLDEIARQIEKGTYGDAGKVKRAIAQATAVSSYWASPPTDPRTGKPVGPLDSFGKTSSPAPHVIPGPDGRPAVTYQMGPQRASGVALNQLLGGGNVPYNRATLGGLDVDVNPADLGRLWTSPGNLPRGPQSRGQSEYGLGILNRLSGGPR